MKESLATLAVCLVVLFLLALASIALNDTVQEQCESRGGQFYRSLDAGKSFCAEPGKAAK
jgi:hypothetical protein